MAPPRVLLAADPRFGLAEWWSFDDPVEEVEAGTAAGVPAVLARVDRATRDEGLWAVGFVSYEAAPAWEPRAVVREPAAGVPLAWFGLYRSPQPAPPPRLLANFVPPALAPNLTPDDHAAAIAAIHAAIARGDTYQVNFTYRLRGQYMGEPEDLFAHLVAAQSSPYSALIEHCSWAVASVSPELFFEREGLKVRCRPMKGTTRRGRTLAEDARLGRELAGSVKERAENLMIVDMVRNDLGRLARPGTVRVPRLFTVERYATVSQMTSEVEAEIDATLAELFAALFPCASITGAPKLRTQEILAGLETSPRGIYTGALGFMAPGGNARLSVAIRTAWIDRARGTVEYGTGSGIVWDSRAEAELAEARVKARVLEPAAPPFELFETLLWRLGHGFALLDRHLERMADSADYFLWPFNRAAALSALSREVAEAESGILRVRLMLDQAGGLRVSHQPLERSPRRWRVALAPFAVDSADRFLFHKTTRRGVYERAAAAVPGVDEVLLWNGAGELTEGTRTNLALRLEGQLWTPPVECGLLAGCLRAELLARGRLHERVLRREDLDRAEGLFLMSSVRGWLRAAVTE